MLSWLKKLRERRNAARADKRKDPDFGVGKEFQGNARDVAWNGTTTRDARRSHPGGGPL